jgi:hypothetical protein
MRIILFKKGLFTLFAFCVFTFANSQQQPDSLMRYLEIAAKNNTDVLQKFNEYQVAMQKIPQAGGLNNPELSVGVFLSPMEILSGNQVADIRLMQMFPWFGVQRTWYELYKVKEDIRISEENTELLHSIERISLAKFKAGPAGQGEVSSGAGNRSGNNSQSLSTASSGMQSMGGNVVTSSNASPGATQSNSMGETPGGSGLADLYRIQIEIGELENNIALLKNQQNTITARFNSYLNRPAISTVWLPDRLSADTLGMSILAIPDSIQQNNPMLKMLKYEQLSLDARKNMVSRMSYPMVGLGVNYTVISKNEMSTSAMNGKDMIMPMVTVTLPVYRKKYRAMRTETDFMKAGSEQGYQSNSNSLQTEYYEAIQLYQDAQRRISLYENQSRLAHNTLDILIKSFSASGSGLTDVLRIRQQILDYDFKSVEALTDYNTAIAWLKRLMVYSQIK